MSRVLTKLIVSVFARTAGLFLLVTCCLAHGAGQDARLEIGNLDKLAAKASEIVEVSLDERLLQLAAKVFNTNNPEELKIKELVSGLKGVYVRVFEFEKPGEYDLSDIDALRAQLQPPGWTKIVGVRSKRDGQNVDVHIKYQGNNILGLAIVAAEPKELTVVNIVGPIDLEKLSQLGGQFGIPRLELEKVGKGKSRN
jgi:hypothetical protein